MQSIYGFIAITSIVILLLLNVVTFAIPPDDNTAARLGMRPDSWELVVDSAKWNDATPQTVKEHLVSFLEKTRMPVYKVVSSISLALFVAFSFSCIGWMRERKWNRNKA